MNKKQILLFSVLSAFIISGFGIASVMASGNTTGVLNQIQEIQKRFGITLTEDQKVQMEAKQKETEIKRSEELSKWQSMTLETWKQQEIDKINSTTQDQFDKMKERQVNMLKNGKEFTGEFKNKEKLAE